MIDVFGLGNAIVDTEVRVDEGFLREQAITKGHMTLIDSQTMRALLTALVEHNMSHSSGGSAANTIYAVQAFGLQTAYACKVNADEAGKFFVGDMAAAGVHINQQLLEQPNHTGQCLVMITKDAERTMTTDLGISSALSMTDVDTSRLTQAKYYYVEGYLSSSSDSSAAAQTCRELAEEAGVKVAVSLSDPSMVEIFRDELQNMLGNGVHTLFCNEEEALTWARTDRIEIATNELKDIAPELYITLGANGSLAVKNGHAVAAPGVTSKPIDTNGAGDMYAGAVLAARVNGASPEDAARFGNHCAAELIKHYGARLGAASDYVELRQSFS